MSSVSRPTGAGRATAIKETWPLPDILDLCKKLLRALFDIQGTLFDQHGQFHGSEEDLKELARIFLRLAKLGQEQEGHDSAGDKLDTAVTKENVEGTDDVEEDELFKPTCVLLGKPPNVDEKMVNYVLGTTFSRTVWNFVNMFIDVGANHAIALTLLIQCAPAGTNWPFPAISNIHGLLDDSKFEPAPVTDSSFTYKPLPSSREWFRILVLWPAERRNDPIKCSLAFERVSSEVRYEALSYTWGKSNDTRTISVDGNPFEATSNLSDALEELRYMGKKPRVLWIDAVCINQRDMSEKSSQVQMMATIYQQASRVIIWLGPISNTSATFWDLLDWYRGATTEWEALNPGKDQDQFFMPLDLDTSGRLAVHKFLSRPYFGRAWVLQEAILAKHAVVRCGNREMDWETFGYFVCDFRYAYLEDTWNGLFSRAMFFDDELERTYHKHHEIVSGSRLMNLPFLIVAIRGARKRGRKLTMCELLKYARLQAATDSRDKVYSILGLLDDDERAYLPTPDYSSHFLSVFSIYAKISIIQSGTLALLAAVHTYRNSPFLETRDLPSWVPDWRNPDRPMYDRPLMPVESLDIGEASIFNASLYPRSPYPFNFLVQDRVLCARGIRLGKLPSLPGGHTLNFEMGDGASISLSKNLRNLVADHRKSLIEAGTYVRDEFWRIMSWDRSARSISKALNKTRRINSDGVKLMTGGRFPPRDDEEEQLLLTKSRDEFIDEDGYQISVSSSMGLIVRTSSGHLGSFPLKVKQDDEVVILFGHDKPVVLRRCHDYYIFVAESYVHGVMDGEIVRDQEAGKYETEEFQIA